jgi:hypothetical protein
VHVDRARQLGAGEVDQKPAGEHRGRLCRIRVDTLLPLVRALGAQREALRRAKDADRLEVRRLEQDLGRRVGDLGLEPAHDRSERDRLLPVRDQQVAREELTQRAVERAERLSLARSAHHDPSAGQQRAVEGV